MSATPSLDPTKPYEVPAVPGLTIYPISADILWILDFLKNPILKGDGRKAKPIHAAQAIYAFASPVQAFEDAQKPRGDAALSPFDRASLAFVRKHAPSPEACECARRAIGACIAAQQAIQPSTSLLKIHPASVDILWMLGEADNPILKGEKHKASALQAAQAIYAFAEPVLALEMAQSPRGTGVLSPFDCAALAFVRNHVPFADCEALLGEIEAHLSVQAVAQKPKPLLGRIGGFIAGAFGGRKGGEE